MIDMHAHWRPAEVIDALRARTREPYVTRDKEGREVAEKPVTVPDFNATIAHAVGLPLGFVVHSPSGRPFKVADKGQPVQELLA